MKRAAARPKLLLMKRHLAIALALVAVLLQTAQPLFAAMTPVMSKAAATTMANQHCVGAGAVTMTQNAVAAPGAAQTMPMHPGGDRTTGCCCQGPWSCGGPCGFLPLGSLPVMPTLSTPARTWTLSAGPRLAAAHPLGLLRPPIGS